MVKGIVLLGVQKGRIALRDDGQGQWLRARAAERSRVGALDYLASIPAARSGVPPDGPSPKWMSHVGRMWQTNAEMNTNLSMEPYFRVNSARPRISNLAARAESHYFRGSAGDTYGDTLYRTFLLPDATSCKIDNAVINLIINELCKHLHCGATPCKT